MQQKVREAGSHSLIEPLENDPSRFPCPSGEAQEDLLAIDNIQGNILAGFNKDFQTMLFLKVLPDADEAKTTNLSHFRDWLGRLIPFVATTDEVLAFNRLFKAVRSRRKVETGTVQATWINVALSYPILERLTKDSKSLLEAAGEITHYKPALENPQLLSATEFPENDPFREGMLKRAQTVLGDPLEGEGSPDNWLFGGPGNEADVVIIIASDSAEQLAAEVARIEDSIYSGRTIDNQKLIAQAGRTRRTRGMFAPSGAQIIYKQQGATLPAPLTGHEHFGYLDGISQPGVRGRISDKTNELFTPRLNVNNRDHGKPGQELIWPGEFVFGYSSQNGKPLRDKDGGIIPKPNPSAGPKSGEANVPIWAKDGSILVVRRLRQDVDLFNEFVGDQAKKLGMNSDLLGAKLVGRWKSGAPLMRAALQDNTELADDDNANNNFDFQKPTLPITEANIAAAQCPEPPRDGPCPSKPIYSRDDEFPPAPADTTADVCPFASHIRKTYPRDDRGTLAPEGIHDASTATRRILRRGIPFGDPFFPPKDPDKTRDTGNRGLVFACYQTSLGDQFEFIQGSWCNNPEFKDKRTDDGELVVGFDMIIGHSNTAPGAINGPQPDRSREAVVRDAGVAKTVRAEVGEEWVIPTGGGYFFSPSIDALCLLTGTKR